jgi:hypothetical protein
VHTTLKHYSHALYQESTPHTSNELFLLAPHSTAIVAFFIRAASTTNEGHNRSLIVCCFPITTPTKAEQSHSTNVNAIGTFCFIYSVYENMQLLKQHSAVSCHCMYELFSEGIRPFSSECAKFIQTSQQIPSVKDSKITCLDNTTRVIQYRS